MLDVTSFSKCIKDNLKDRRFGKKRADEILEDFEARAKAYIKTGDSEGDASIRAMKEVFDNLTNTATEKAKRTAAMLAVQAENNARIQQGLKMPGNKGKKLARAAISLVEHDPRFQGLSYTTLKETTRGVLFQALNDVINKAGKGAFGRQMGKVHLPNIVREVFGENTGDQLAKTMAQAWLRTSDLGVDLFNQAGGSMRKLTRYLPQSGMNAAKIVKDKEKWMKSRMDRWDWARMRWPDGSPIDVADRPSIIENVYKTLSTDGATKIDPAAFRGRGRALGNALDQHRFVHYKDAESWLNDLTEFGDGSVFDVMVHHTETMAHQIAMVKSFGPNPDMTFNNIEAMVKKAAADLSPQDKVAAEGVLKNVLRPMLENVSRSNPMNPNSVTGNLITGTSNILTAAQLGSASLLAIPGDFMQSLAVRAFNGMDLFGGINHYFGAIATDVKFAKDISTQSGFVMDQAVMGVYGTTRFSGAATYGPYVTRWISDKIMRATLMNGHTNAARWANQAEFMGLLNRYSKMDFEKLPFVQVLQRYGISKADWDAVRVGIQPHSPKPGVNFLRPIDILSSSLQNKDTLYNKFQGMIFEESRSMVPEATLEAAVFLKGAERPDTLRGAILHSWSMYKNFPVSFWMIYGRLGMTSQSVKGRLGFYAGLGAGMTMVGAMGTQMREIAKGNDPMPMDSPQFLGKAFLSGGALSIWGDFLFSGVNGGGATPSEIIGGPVAGLVKDTTQLALGDVFQWADTLGSLDVKEGDSKTLPKAVEYIKRYTPGSNIWWARLALERQVWDRMQELADPKAYQKRQRKAANQKNTYGNESWWPQGERAPERMPEYQGRE